jgi:starch-binding outer membrane protein, SusD/RagB family
MIKKAGVAALASALLLTLPACNDNEYLTETPLDFLGPENFFQNASDAIAAVNGVYASFITPAGYGADLYYGRDLYMMTEFPGEALTTRFGAAHIRSQLDGFTWGPSSDAMFANVWGAAYRAIADANSVIGNVPRITNMDPALRDRVIGEARFLRAVHYFNLVRLYAGTGPGAGVPLWLEEARPQDNLARPRAPVSEVYQAIIADLEAAAQALPLNYAGVPGNNTGRATRGAANALLAKVHLQYAMVHDGGNTHLQASVEAGRRVLQSGQYQLLPDFERIFALDNENNAEVIFAIQNIRVAGMGGRLAQHVAPQNSGLAGANVPQASFYAEWPFYREWSDQDRRKAATFLSQYRHPVADTVVTWRRPRPGLSNAQITALNNQFGTPNGGPTPRKYMDPNAGTSAAEEPDYILLRHADVLLTLAEALNELGQTGEAATLTNQVRARAGLPNLPAMGQPQLREAIQIERRYELVLEGHTFFDMQRHWEWSKERVERHMNMALPANQPGGEAINAAPWNSSVPKNRTVPIPDRYRFFPVHPAVLASNQALTQTPGWGGVE